MGHILATKIGNSYVFAPAKLKNYPKNYLLALVLAIQSRFIISIKIVYGCSCGVL